MMKLGTLCMLSMMKLGAVAITARKQPLNDVNPPSENDVNPKPVAMCLAGTARTFTEPVVLNSLQNMLRTIHVSGLTNVGAPDMFAFLALQDAEQNAARAMINGDDHAVKQALVSIKAVKYHIDAAPEGLIKNETIPELIPHHDECYQVHDRYFWCNSVYHFLNSVNQAAHTKECVKLIEDYEQQMGKKYAVVILTRPDLRYFENLPENLLQPVFDEGKVVHENDVFMAMPRNVIDGINTHWDAFMQCKPGDSCCGTIGRSEELYEYLFGFEVAGGGWCSKLNCLGDREQSRIPDFKTRHWQIYRPEGGELNACMER
jgi:hypothetical protein